MILDFNNKMKKNGNEDMSQDNPHYKKKKRSQEENWQENQNKEEKGEQIKYRQRPILLETKLNHNMIRFGLLSLFYNE